LTPFFLPLYLYVFTVVHLLTYTDSYSLKGTSSTLALPPFPTLLPSVFLKMSDSSEPRAQLGPVTSEALNQMLKTPCDEVFAFSSDGETYTAPRCLVGTPVRKITETEDYWKSEWLSLETFLGQEKI